MTWRQLLEQLNEYEEEFLEASPLKVMVGNVQTELKSILPEVLGEEEEVPYNLVNNFSLLKSYLEVAPDEQLSNNVRLLDGDGTTTFGQAKLYCFEENYYFFQGMWRPESAARNPEKLKDLVCIKEEELYIRFPGHPTT